MTTCPICLHELDEQGNCPNSRNQQHSQSVCASCFEALLPNGTCPQCLPTLPDVRTLREGMPKALYRWRAIADDQAGSWSIYDNDGRLRFRVQNDQQLVGFLCHFAQSEDIIVRICEEAFSQNNNPLAVRILGAVFEPTDVLPKTPYFPDQRERLLAAITFTEGRDSEHGGRVSIDLNDFLRLASVIGDLATSQLATKPDHQRRRAANLQAAATLVEIICREIGGSFTWSDELATEAEIDGETKES